MRQRFLGLAVLGLLLGGTTSAQAGVVPVGQGAFSGSTLVDFNTPFVDETQLTTQYSGSGVTFSGAIYTMQNFGDTAIYPLNGGGQIASNWVYSATPGLQGDTIEMDFSNPVIRVGFLRGDHPGDTLTLTAFSGVTNLGSLSFPGDQFDTGNPADFVGIEGSQGFDRLILTVSGTDNHFLSLDDLRFDGASDTPEPATLVLLGIGIAGMGGYGWSRKRKSA